tara:strand:+ start:126 stop:1847 length:1722 start_codon:yes stop_codon:yes gene_type:complete
MANEKIIFDTEVKVGSSVGSVKSLKAELRAVTNELQNLEEGSQAFINAAKRAGTLKDKIGDTKATIDAFNPEKKFQALAGAVGIAANGFSALQGAMALMGTENEDLNKTIAKTQGAIALATGLNGLMGMGDAFKNLKNVAGDALKGIKAGIGATGIGLFVIAAGLLVANWEAVTKAIKTSFPIFNDMGKIIEKIRETAYGVGEVLKSAILAPFKAIAKAISGDFSGAVEELKKGYAVTENFKKGAEAGIKANEEIAAQEKLDRLIKQREKELEVDKAAGKDTYKQELALNKLKQTAAKDNQTELEKLRQEERVLVASHIKDLSDKAKAKAKEDKRIADEKKAYDLSFAELVEAQRLKNVEEDKKIADIKTFNAELDLKNAEEAAKKQIEIEKYLNDTKLGIKTTYLNSASETVNALKLLAGGNEELQAAALIAESAISIAKMIIANNAANVAIIAQGASLAIISGGTSVAAAASLVTANNISTAVGVAATIAATGAGLAAIGKSGAPSNGGGGNVTAPNAPRIPQSISGTKLGGNSEVTTTGKSTVGKVIVVETDITATQDRVKGIIRKATIK